MQLEFGAGNSMHVTSPGPVADEVRERRCAHAGHTPLHLWLHRGCSWCLALLSLAGELVGAALGCSEGQGHVTARSESLSQLPVLVCAYPLLEDICSIF